jgi:hypothetical protein
MGDKFTTIRVSKSIKDKLKSMGKKGETYDDVLRRILAALEEKEKNSLRGKQNK